MRSKSIVLSVTACDDDVVAIVDDDDDVSR